MKRNYNIKIDSYYNNMNNTCIPEYCNENTNNYIVVTILVVGFVNFLYTYSISKKIITPPRPIIETLPPPPLYQQSNDEV